MKKSNLTEIEKEVLEKRFNFEQLTEEEFNLANTLMIEHILTEYIFNTLVSGIILKEHLPLYEKMLEYGESEKFKFISSFEETIDIEEARTIIKDIKEGKEKSKDGYGRELQIVSVDIFNKEKVYLIKDYNNLFKLSVGKEYDELIEGFTNKVDIGGRIKVICKDLFTDDDETSVVLNGTNINKAFYPLGVQLRGRVVITGADINNEWNGLRSLKVDEVLHLLSHAHTWGSVSINTDLFFEFDKFENMFKTEK